MPEPFAFDSKLSIFLRVHLIYIAFRLYHNNDKHVPVFEELQSLSNITKKDKEAAIDRIVKILVTEPPHPSFVCTKTPSYVKDNKSFLVDTTKLQNVKDLLSDDCGSWTNNGQHKFYYEETPEGYAKMGKDVDMAGNCNNYITVNRIYYYNKNAKDFRRTITFITGTATLVINYGYHPGDTSVHFGRF